METVITRNNTVPNFHKFCLALFTSICVFAKFNNQARWACSSISNNYNTLITVKREKRRIHLRTLKQHPKKKKKRKTRIKGTWKSGGEKGSFRFNQLLQFPMLTTLLTSSPRRPTTKEQDPNPPDPSSRIPIQAFLTVVTYRSCVCYLHLLGRIFLFT